MATFNRHRSLDVARAFPDGEDTAQSPTPTPIAVFSCNRLGLQANPPAPSFGGWFRRR
jgi:hypothetical protein